MKSSSWKSLGREGRKNWVCSSCRNSNSKARTQSLTQDAEEDITSLSASAKLDKLLEMKGTMDEIKKTIDFLSSQYDEVLKDLKATKEENKKLKEEVKELKVKQARSDEEVKELTYKLNDLDMYGRRVNLEIFGASVRGPSLENEDTTAVVRELAENIGVQYNPSEIHRLHRLQARKDGKPPIILIQFMSVVTRDNWLQAGRRAKLVDNASGNKVFFGENLTVFFKGLLREAKRRANINKYDFVWVRNGRILVRKNDRQKNVIIVTRYEDLDKIV